MKIKYLFLVIFSNLIACANYAQNSNPRLDTALARKLGADDYGMKNYIFVALKSGNNKNATKAFTDSCFKGHLTNIGKLAEAKKLVVAGPFGKNEANYRGLFILTQIMELKPTQLHFSSISSTYSHFGFHNS